MDDAARLALNELSYCVIGAALEVHKTLGPGLLESVYRTCLIHELKSAAIGVDAEQIVPIIYKDIVLDCGYRLDLLVENQIIVELKSVEKILPVHTAQILSYLRLTNKPLGLLMNFNVPYLKQGIHRVING